MKSLRIFKEGLWALAHKSWQQRWSRYFLIWLLVCCAISASIMASPFRLGVDVARIFGYPSCLPSIFYLIDYRPENYNLTRWGYPLFKMPETPQWREHRWGPPPGSKVIKLAAAIEGDKVKINGTDLYINGFPRDRLWLAKSIPGKTVGDFDCEYTVEKGKFFAYGTEKESFDSRYFGTVPTESIVGYARPLF